MKRHARRFAPNFCIGQCVGIAGSKFSCLLTEDYGRRLRQAENALVSDTDEVRSGSSIRLNVLFEVVQNGLPALTLLLDGVRRLRVKGFAYRDAILPSYKLDQQYPAAESALDQLMLDDIRIGPSEIKAHAAIPGFHAR